MAVGGCVKIACAILTLAACDSQALRGLQAAHAGAAADIADLRARVAALTAREPAAGPRGERGTAGADGVRLDLVDASTGGRLGAFIGTLAPDGAPDGWAYVESLGVRLNFARAVPLVYEAPGCTGPPLGVDAAHRYIAPTAGVLSSMGEVLLPLADLAPEHEQGSVLVRDGVGAKCMVCAPCRARRMMALGVRLRVYSPSELDVVVRGAP